MRINRMYIKSNAQRCARIIEQACINAQLGQMSLPSCIGISYICEVCQAQLYVMNPVDFLQDYITVLYINILFVYMLYLNKRTLLTQSAGSCLWWSLENIIWSSNCHLIAIRWSLFRPVRYHGWIVPQSSDHDAVADVSVVTLVALPANPGNPWKPCFRTSWDRTQILCPPVLDLTSSCSMSKTVKLCPTHFPPQTSASAIILWKYFICGRTLTSHMTNAHPGPQPNSFAPTAVVLWSSLMGKGLWLLLFFCWSPIVGPNFLQHQTQQHQAIAPTSTFVSCLRSVAGPSWKTDGDGDHSWTDWKFKTNCSWNQAW